MKAQHFDIEMGSRQQVLHKLCKTDQPKNFIPSFRNPSSAVQKLPVENWAMILRGEQIAAKIRSLNSFSHVI